MKRCTRRFSSHPIPNLPGIAATNPPTTPRTQPNPPCLRSLHGPCSPCLAQRLYPASAPRRARLSTARSPDCCPAGLPTTCTSLRHASHLYRTRLHTRTPAHSPAFPQAPPGASAFLAPHMAAWLPPSPPASLPPDPVPFISLHGTHDLLTPQSIARPCYCTVFCQHNKSSLRAGIFMFCSLIHPRAMCTGRGSTHVGG